jgi:hypothetical protein
MRMMVMMRMMEGSADVVDAKMHRCVAAAAADFEHTHYSS